VWDYFRKRNVSSISESTYIRQIERKIKQKLSKERKEMLLNAFHERGWITRSEARNGRSIVILGGI